MPDAAGNFRGTGWSRKSEAAWDRAFGPTNRRPDGSDPATLEPGEYAYTGDAWWLRLPNGAKPRALTDEWDVTEHADRTITVAPSILDLWTGWHGYLERGRWRVAVPAEPPHEDPDDRDHSIPDPEPIKYWGR